MKKTNQYVLGVAVTGRSIEAILLKQGVEGPEVVRHFRRNRASGIAEPGHEAAYSDTPDKTEAFDDFTTLQIGGSGSGSEFFLGSEFNTLDNAPLPGDMGNGEEAFHHTFELELTDILEECREAGFEDPQIAFCAGSQDVTTVELTLQRKRQKETPAEPKEKEGDKPKSEKAKARQDKKSLRKKSATKKSSSGSRRERLLEQLRAQHEDNFDAERVAFLPMTALEMNTDRFLAVVPVNNDPVVNTIRVLRGQKSRMPAVQLLDAEVSAFLGLARSAERYLAERASQDESTLSMLPGDGGEFATEYANRTLVVRAGVEDTLVMFLESERLLHFETLRSITTFDAPETICSRVLLLQDEYATGDVQRILILGEDREETLVESFSLFFPDATVGSLSEFLPRSAADVEAHVPLRRSTVFATVIALRLLKDERYEGVFEPVNLLPKKLLKRQFKLPVTWHVMALYAVLFVTVLFFVARYFKQSHEADMYRYRVEAMAPSVTDADARELQGRIDSLKAVSNGYVRALDVIDSLLVGSDLWSRSMEKTTRETATVSGVWIDGWRYKNAEGVIELEGSATTRNNVVYLADRLDATIEKLTFSEIREWPVFSFSLRMPVSQELPEAARYLRERVEIEPANGAPPVTPAADVTTEDPAPKATAKATALGAHQPAPDPAAAPDTPEAGLTAETTTTPEATDPTGL